MSGGHFNYSNDNAARDIFGWDIDVKYGLSKLQDDAKLVAKEDPLEDREISELAYDLFCLLHSYDWYRSCDTDVDTYRNDLRFFKKKWLERGRKERIDFLVERAVERINEQAQEEIKFINSFKEEE